MSGVEYRIYVDGLPASRELTRAIDLIQVSQMTSAPWEAQLVIPVCMNAQGSWDHEAEDYVSSRTKFRVELMVRGAWTALIDGVTTGAEVAMSGDPGRSSITVHIQDATDELERDRAPRSFGAERTVVDVVRELLQNRTNLEEAQIDEPEAATGERHAPDELSMSQASAYDYLRTLASDHGMYIYVLPPQDAGQRSRAFFGRMPGPAGDRPPTLVLAGPERNIERFDVTSGSNRPGRIVSRTIDVREREVRTTTVTLSNRSPDPGAEVAADEDVEASVSPRQLAAVGPDLAASAVLERSGYVIRAEGAVEGRCYAGVLRPYGHIDVRGINQRLSGTYLIHAVTHRLSRAGYRQEFTLWRNTLSSGGPSTGTGESGRGMHPW